MPPESRSRLRELVRPARQGLRVPVPGRHPLPRRHPPGRQHQDETAYVHPGPGTAELLAEAVKGAARRHPPHPVGNTGRWLLLRFGAESASPTSASSAPAPPPRSPARPSPTTSPSTSPRQSASPACPTSGPPPRRHRLAALLRPPQADHRDRVLGTSVGFTRYAGAHQFGYGGHPLTKSRRYSVTFGYIRRERAEYRKAQR